MASVVVTLPPVSDWFDHYGYAEVADGLLTGAYPLDDDDIARIAAEHVTRVFNLCEDLEYEPGEREGVEQALQRFGIVERRLHLVDYGGLLPGQLELATGEVMEWLEEGERVYLHCRAGWQRSAAVAAGVVARRDDLDLDEALRRIRERKPSAEPLPHQVEDLRRWWHLRSVRKEA
jgi:atypical dual specificity phosphatase